MWSARIGPKQPVRSYLFALATVALGTLFRLGLDPILGEHHPFTLYFGAVALTAWYGGLRPALLAIGLSYFAADWFFITPRFEFNLPHTNLDEFIALLAFLFSCLAIAVTSHIMRKALQTSRKKQAELEREICERERAEEALRQAQSQLRQYAASLEERVAERTTHLQETVRSLEGVCYHLAHDLRAPLRAMDGFTTILLREQAPRLDESSQSYLEKISQAASRMDELIHGLLEYGRLGHGDFPLVDVDIKAALERVVASESAELSARRARLNVSGDWPQARAHPGLAEFVLSNLLSNALKFVPSEVLPLIEVGVETHEGWARYWLKDNGIGIAPEYHSRIFWPFERLNPQVPGTGMGLAIVSKAIERMGGRVGLESSPGAGSRFWFELPIAARANRAPQTTKSANKLESSRTADHILAGARS